MNLEFDLAPRSDRYKAGLVDGVIFVITFLVSIPLVNQLLSRVGHAEFTVLWMLVFFLGYETIPVRLWGQTLGHRIYGLQVVDARGHRPGFLPLLHRWFLKCFLGLRNFRTMDYGSKTAAHDNATGTYVIHAR